MGTDAGKGPAAGESLVPKCLACSSGHFLPQGLVYLSLNRECNPSSRGRGENAWRQLKAAEALGPGQGGVCRRGWIPLPRGQDHRRGPAQAVIGCVALRESLILSEPPLPLWVKRTWPPPAETGPGNPFTHSLSFKRNGTFEGRGHCRRPGLGTHALSIRCGKYSLVALTPGGLRPGHFPGWDQLWWAWVCRNLARPFPGPQPTPLPWPLPEPGATPVPFKEQMKMPLSCDLQSPGHSSLCPPLFLVPGEARG